MNTTKWTRRKFFMAAILGGTIPHLLACTLQLQPQESPTSTQLSISEPPATENDLQTRFIHQPLNLLLKRNLESVSSFLA